MIFVVIPVLVSCMVRNLKYLTPFSTVANILMAVGVSVVVYEAAQDLPPVATRAYIADWQQLPLYFGTVIYAFEGIGLVSFGFVWWLVRWLKSLEWRASTSECNSNHNIFGKIIRIVD